MDGVGRSNPVTSVLKEKALAAWRFQPSAVVKERENAPDVAWIMQASQRDMEFVVQALQRELNSGPHKAKEATNPGSNSIIMERNNAIIINNNTTTNPDSLHSSSDVASSTDSGSPSQGQAPNSQAPPTEPPPLPKKIAAKRRSRGASKTQITFVAADPGNFRDMVQQVTGIPFVRTAAAAGGGGGGGGGTVLKPQPKRPCRSANVGALSMLESSSFPHNNPYPYPYPYPSLGFPGGVSGFTGEVTPPSHHIPFYNPGLTAGSLGVTSPSLGSSSSRVGYYDNYLQNVLFQKSENHHDARFVGLERHLELNNTGDSRWSTHQNSHK